MDRYDWECLGVLGGGIGVIAAVIGLPVYFGMVLPNKAPKEQVEEVFEDLDFDEMVDTKYAIDGMIRFEGGICYETGLPSSPGEGTYLSILFEDDLTGEAFIAHTGMGNQEDHSKANALLTAVNCEEDFVVYGQKILNEQGNPELKIGTLEFKMGPYRIEQINLHNKFSPQEGGD